MFDYILCFMLNRKSEEYRKELSNLEHRYQEDIKNLEKDKERTKEQEQLQRQAARKEMKEKDIVKEECQRLKRKLDESENENAALKLSHKEEIGAQKEEIRKIEERLEAKNNQLTNQLDNERKAKEDALLKKSEEYRKELSNLEHRYQEDIKNLEKDKERFAAKEYMDFFRFRLKKKLDESENENAALKLSHKEEIGALKEEIRKIEERKSSIALAKVFKVNLDQSQELLYINLPVTGDRNDE
ncbi:hypothetical protein CHS0354_018689 [Potamilus streckersoni]|uniref:Uncharacterized protein n=1 Tax=Potamilus streckersoni TaxID=2493646 RepID=A0AAE0VWW0_9BIVA|nr:hypothetical protein CHS0354_018689 [Potamilus streckersoni]